MAINAQPPRLVGGSGGVRRAKVHGISQVNFGEGAVVILGGAATRILGQQPVVEHAESLIHIGNCCCHLEPTPSADPSDSSGSWKPP